MCAAFCLAAPHQWSGCWKGEGVVSPAIQAQQVWVKQTNKNLRCGNVSSWRDPIDTSAATGNKHAKQFAAVRLEQTASCY